MTASTLTGLGIDVLALFMLVGWLYRRRAAAPEMTMVFVTLNIGLVAALTAITAGHFPAGVGFGLFGLLSLVRLRSAAFSIKDVAYTFSALVLGLVNGLPDRHLALIVALNVLVLAAVWLVDDSKTRVPTRVLRLTLDQALVDRTRCAPRSPDVWDMSPSRWWSSRSTSSGRPPWSPYGTVSRRAGRACPACAIPPRSSRPPATGPSSSVRRTGPRRTRRASVPDLPGLDSLPRITLPEVLAAAPATTRIDRKYLVPTGCGEEFLGQIPASLRLLSIDGRLMTSYRSTYFDTADLLTCRAHIQGRRRRWKARSRLYVEDRLCRLELKLRDGSGLTRKFFHPTEADAYGHMNGGAAAFFATQLRAHGLLLASSLEPAVEVSYAVQPWPTPPPAPA